MSETPSEADDLARDFLQSKLERHPDVAAAFGRYMASFAILEQDLMQMFGRVLGTNYAGAQRLLGNIQSFSLKLEAVASFAPLSKNMTDDEKAQCAVVFEIAKACNSFRNRLVHGAFCTNRKGELLLHAYSTSPTRGKPDPKPINAKIIEDRRTLDLDRLTFLILMFLDNKPTPKGILTNAVVAPE